MAGLNPRTKFVRALVLINLAVGWAAMAFLPRELASFSYQSPSEKVLKRFFLSYDWSMIFAIVGMSSLVTIALWLILSSYDKLPGVEAPQSTGDEEGERALEE